MYEQIAKKRLVGSKNINANVYLPAQSEKLEKETRLKGFSAKAGVILQSRWELTGITRIKEQGGKDFLSFPIRHFMFQCSSSIEVQL